MSQIVGSESSVSTAELNVTIVPSNLVLSIQVSGCIRAPRYLTLRFAYLSKGGDTRTLAISRTNTIEATAYDPDGTCEVVTTIACSALGLQLNGTTLVIEANTLSAGSYTFIFSSSCEDGRSKTAQVTVTMQGKGATRSCAVAVDVPSSYALTGVFNPSDRLVIHATTSGPSGNYSWESALSEPSWFSTGTSGLYLTVVAGNYTSFVTLALRGHVVLKPTRD
jgi:hypothetical protein